MPKKSKRKVTSSSYKPKDSSPSRAAASSTNRVSNGDFNPDYSYVIKDLKRIGTLAGSFFVILIVLAIFLGQ